MIQCRWYTTLLLCLLTFSLACNTESQSTEQQTSKPKKDMTAKEILGNPDYPAISFGGYRDTTREIQPTVAQLKEDMQILHAMGIRLLRTYHTKRPHARNVLQAIRELKDADPNFEMYVMVGVWIDCKGAWTDSPDHNGENAEENAAELARAVDMAQTYPDIVKVIAVGNEAMVKWAAGYFVQANVILKYVNQLQGLKQAGELPMDLWVTSSDNFASWGGGDGEYHTEDLKKLIQAVDFVSMHTYPMHDTHYNSDFWGVAVEEANWPFLTQVNKAMIRARDYAIGQFQGTADYIHGIAPEKPIHIGETGWATESDALYGPDGSKACDEYKSGMYFKLMRQWAKTQNISCFYFEAFDEPWKGGKSPGDSEKHFGLFDVDGKAKFPVWEYVDKGVFEGLSRGGNPIVKTYTGNQDSLLRTILAPPTLK